MANPQTALAKWKRNMATAAESMKAGVADVSINPAEQAAAAAPKWQAKLQEAFANGSYVKGLQSVSLNDWKAAMTGKGAQNMTNGAQNISPRSQKAITDVVAYANTVKAQVATMPNTTEADADQRALAAIRMMRDYKKNK